MLDQQVYPDLKSPLGWDFELEMSMIGFGYFMNHKLGFTHDFDNERISDIASRHQWIKQYHSCSINSWFCKNQSILTIFLFWFNFSQSASEKKTETILDGFFMKFWTGPRHNVPVLHLLRD